MWLKFVCLIICIAEVICGCQNDWLQFENKCFKYFQVKVNYKNAIQMCKGHNATLASVHSREELNYLQDIARHFSTASGVHWIWLGGRRIKTNRTNVQTTTISSVQSSNKLINQSMNTQFEWQDGSPFNYTEWRNNCPDLRKDEDCILMSIFSSRSSHWCNYKCDSNQDHVICQYYLNDRDDTKSSNKSSNSTEIKEEKNQTEFGFNEGVCDIGWTLNENNCYKFYETNQTWPVAKAMCIKNGADLVTIDSESEQMYVQNFLFTISGAQEAVWLGAKRKGDQQDFTWIDNTPFIYQNWAPHEPDYRNNLENCLAMNNVDEFFGLWLDAPCEIAFGVACKKRAKMMHGCSKIELLNEAQKAVQMNDFIIQLLQQLANRIEEDRTQKENKESKAVAMEIKSEVDSILQNSSLIRLSLHLNLFICFVFILLMISIALIIFRRRHLIKKPYLSIFSFKNLNYDEKNLNTNDYEELLYNHNLNSNVASSSNNTRNLTDKV